MAETLMTSLRLFLCNEYVKSCKVMLSLYNYSMPHLKNVVRVAILFKICHIFAN